MKRIIVCSGVPRSGTSWVGQILDSSPSVRYRYQPLFSRQFKDVLNEKSTREEYLRSFKNIYDSQDPFLCQTERRDTGIYPKFKEKLDIQPVLVLKMVRYQALLSLMLQYVPFLKVVCVIRHPCAVLNSWFRTKKEFPVGALPSEEWEHGKCRNVGPTENVWGFRAWQRISQLYLSLAQAFPGRVLIIRYEELVSNTIVETKKLFMFCDLSITEQTVEFLKETHEKHIEDPYAVFKNKSVKDRWRNELDKEIANKVTRLVSGSSLERFLE